MSTQEMNSKVKELRELRRMADELAGADWKITYKPVISSRLDSAALKKALPDVAAQFTKSATSRRFCVA